MCELHTSKIGVFSHHLVKFSQYNGWIHRRTQFWLANQGYNLIGVFRCPLKHIRIKYSIMVSAFIIIFPKMIYCQDNSFWSEFACKHLKVIMLSVSFNIEKFLRLRYPIIVARYEIVSWHSENSFKKKQRKNEEIMGQNGRLLKAVLVNTLLTFYSEAILHHRSWPKCNVVVRLH